MHVMRHLLALVVLIGLLAVPVLAQSSGPETPHVTIDKRKLLVQPRNADGTLQVVSFWEDPVLWSRDQQQIFYGSMSGAMRRIKTDAPLAAATTLMLLSFGYGVFHAAGPGHGKTVISAWLLATENELRRGIVIAFMSAIIQAVTAIVIVSILLIVVASVGAVARDVAGVLESASYAMIGALGLYLVWTAFRPHFQRPQHQHHHDHGADCGHAHVPEARTVKGNWSLAKAFSLAFAVGIRPCTGAILVLVFANALGLYWAGIVSTFAMAIGTFLTVSLIATLAVYSKKLAVKFAGRNDRWLGWLSFGLRLGGGAAIMILGAVLFTASLATTNAMM